MHHSKDAQPRADSDLTPPGMRACRGASATGRPFATRAPPRADRGTPNPLSGRKGQAMLLCSSRGDWRGFEESPDPAGEEALDAADGFAVGLAFGDAASDVGACCGVASLLGDGDEVERPVELAVAASVESVSSLVLAGGCRHR